MCLFSYEDIFQQLYKRVRAVSASSLQIGAYTLIVHNSLGYARTSNKANVEKYRYRGILKYRISNRLLKIPKNR